MFIFSILYLKQSTHYFNPDSFCCSMADVSKLQSLNNDITLYAAKSTFESSTLSINDATANSTALPNNEASGNPIDEVLTKRITNPTLVDEEITYYKQYLSKLKFLYLEQETRDKFLRRVLIDKKLDISNEEITTITEENNESKANLKQLKGQIDAVISKIEGLTNEIIESNHTYRQKLTEINGLTTEIDQMDAQLNGIINEIENNEDNLLLFNLQKSVGNFTVVNFEKILEISNHQLTTNITQYQALSEQIETKFAEHSDKANLIAELNLALQSLIDSGSSAPDTNNESQIWAHLLNQLNQLLETLLNESISLVRIGDVYQLQLENYKIVLTSGLTIVNIAPSTAKLARLAEAINDTSLSLSRWEKFLSLLAILTEPRGL